MILQTTFFLFYVFNILLFFHKNAFFIHVMNVFYNYAVIYLCNCFVPPPVLLAALSLQDVCMCVQKVCEHAPLYYGAL